MRSTLSCHFLLVVDPLLEPFVGDLFGLDFSDPFWLDTRITVVSAGREPRLICRAGYPGEFHYEPGPQAAPTGFHLGPALDATLAQIGPDWESGRGIHLAVVASASANQDEALDRQFARLRAIRRLNVVAVDLGGFLQAYLGRDWSESVDYVVTHPGPSVRQADLRSLFDWFPRCRHGFHIHHLEGHWPQMGPSPLEPPPPPFTWDDCMAARWKNLDS